MSLFSLEETFLRCLEGVEVEKRLGRPLRGNPGLFVCRLLTIQESQEVRGRIFLERRAIIKVVQKHPKTRNGLECKFFGFRSIQLLSRCEPPSIKNDSSGHSCWFGPEDCRPSIALPAAAFFNGRTLEQDSLRWGGTAFVGVSGCHCYSVGWIQTERSAD